MSTHRPYSRDRSAPPSVTTVIDLLSKPGLSWAAATETAKYAIHNGQWLTEPEHQALHRLRKHHRGVWDHRALLGTAIHSLNSTWARGEEQSVGDLISRMRSESRLWASRDNDDIYVSLKPLIAALSAAWLDLEPQTEGVDEILRYPHTGVDYIGTSDWRAKVKGKSYLIDLKSTAKDADKARTYWDSWRLQLAAYRFATELLTYKDDEVATVEGAAEVEATAILLLCGDGSWQFLPCSATEDDHKVFLDLRKVFAWVHNEGSWSGVDAWVD